MLVGGGLLVLLVRFRPDKRPLMDLAEQERNQVDPEGGFHQDE